MNICVIGTGYVGLVTGAGLAEFGLNVVCIDNDQEKIDLLSKKELGEKKARPGQLTRPRFLVRSRRQANFIFS